MDTAAILALVLKGISIAEAVWDNRDLALGAIQSVRNIIEKKETVTKEELDAVEAQLDGMLDEFNSDLPEEA